jgi:hypothetical protein
VRFAGSITLVLAVAAVAQEDHSAHHAATALGKVDFPVSCSEQARPLMTRGVALLHSFGYEEARLTFEEAAKADKNCSMAWWGVARSWYHPIWAPPNAEELGKGAAALERSRAIPAATERERAWIESLGAFYADRKTADHPTRARAYARSLGNLSSRFPDDDEAAIFYALQLVAVGYLDPTDHSYAWQKQGSEILNRLLPSHPDHPGIAHYIIHSTDYPALAELGLKAARAYSKIAPDSAHALHMPSHIFTRLGLWDDSIASNIASARAGSEQAQRLHGGGGSFDQLHAMDYLVYAYLQEGRDKSARRVLADMSAMTRLDEEQFAAAYAFAASPAREALERHDWKSAAALKPAPAWFDWNRFRNAEALVYYANGIGAARSGDAAAARASASTMDAIARDLPASRDYDWSGSIRVQIESLNALVVYATDRAAGIERLRAAADREDAIDKHPVTPGALLPARELLADLLLENGRAADALREYRAVLKIAPRRFNSIAGAGRAAEMARDGIAARAYASELAQMAAGAETPRPELEWARGILNGR